MKRVLKSMYDDEEDDPFQKQFKNLEIEWDSIKQSISRSDRRKPTTVGDHRPFQLYDNSPKQLMSLLQLQIENSPAEAYFPNSGLDDRAAIEVIEQREADFDNGRLRGRKLFEEFDMGSDENGGIHGECFDMDENSEVSTEFSCKGFENYDENCSKFCSLRCSCSDSPPFGEAERGVTVKKSGGSHGSVGRFMIYVAVMLAVAIIVFKCSGEDELILVPT